jgi:hypothetical protein
LVDFVPIDFGNHGTLVVETTIAFKTKQNEGGNDEQEQNAHHDLGVVSDKIKHVRTLCLLTL